MPPKGTPKTTSNEGPTLRNRSIASYMAQSDPDIPNIPDISNRELFRQMSEKFDMLREDLTSEIEDLKLHSMEMQRENANLRKQVARLEDKVDDLENRSRRDNLIFYGIPEAKNQETWEQAEDAVIGVLENHLGITDVNIDRAHRIGIKKPKKTRPIIVKMDFKSKEKILRQKAKLRDETTYSVSEDFTKKVRVARSQLWKYSQDNELEDAKIKFDKLYHKRKVYTYDDVSKTVVSMD